MIRRGLQLVVGVGIFMMLGAAPSFGQSGVKLPQSITLQNIIYPTNQVNPNGMYVMTTAETQSGSLWYTRFGTSNAPTYTLEVRTSGANPVSGLRHLLIRSGAFVADAGTQTIKTGAYPHQYGPFSALSGSGYSGGQILWAAPPDNEYSSEFPDWASAAVKIPLGFGFAMSFWAAAVTLSISMRWVRDLASAAT